MHCSGAAAAQRRSGARPRVCSWRAVRRPFSNVRALRLAHAACFCAAHESCLTVAAAVAVMMRAGAASHHRVRGGRVCRRDRRKSPFCFLPTGGGERRRRRGRRLFSRDHFVVRTDSGAVSGPQPRGARAAARRGFAPLSPALLPTLLQGRKTVTRLVGLLLLSCLLYNLARHWCWFLYGGAPHRPRRLLPCPLLLVTLMGPRRLGVKGSGEGVPSRRPSPLLCSSPTFAEEISCSAWLGGACPALGGKLVGGGGWEVG